LSPYFIFLAIGTRIRQDAAITYASIKEGTPIFQIMSLPQFQQDWHLQILARTPSNMKVLEGINFTLLAWSCRTMYIEVQQQPTTKGEHAHRFIKCIASHCIIIHKLHLQLHSAP
jgi:hypothetical protein